MVYARGPGGLDNSPVESNTIVDPNLPIGSKLEDPLRMGRKGGRGVDVSGERPTEA